MDENVISVLRANDFGGSGGTSTFTIATNNNNNNKRNANGDDDAATATTIKINNHNDCAESQRLLMHLDDDFDGNDGNENLTASRTKINGINSIIGSNDFELVKNYRHNQDNDNNNENNCSGSNNSSNSSRSSNSSDISSVHSRNKNSTSDRKCENHQSGHNVIEFDATIISPTNPFRVDCQSFERVLSPRSAQSKPNNCNNNAHSVRIEKNLNVVEANKSISFSAAQQQQNPNNTIEYQRNAKSLGYLIDCSCSPSCSGNCKNLRHTETTWIMRRTKSSTGIMEYERRSSSDIDSKRYAKHDPTDNAEDEINKRPVGDAYNGRLRAIFGKTNGQHSMNVDSQQPRPAGIIKEFVQQRWQSLRLLSQQKFQQMSKQRKPFTPPETNTSGGGVNGRGTFVEIPSRSDVRIDGFDADDTMGRTNSLTHPFGESSAREKLVDECSPLMMTTTTSHHQLKTFEYSTANIADPTQHNVNTAALNDSVSNADRSNTNPFLGQSSDNTVDAITGENNIDADRSALFAASNEPKETIFNQLITNDDNRSMLNESCSITATNDFNILDDNERNIFDNLDKSQSARLRAHSHRTKPKHRHAKKPNDALSTETGENNDDTDQWNSLAMPARCATLMKYGSKRHSQKNSRSHNHNRHHNQSSDDLTLADDTTGYQYVVKETSPRKRIAATNELRQHLINDDQAAHHSRVYSAYGRNQRRITGSIGDIPTCPFQRQDYTNPNDDGAVGQQQQQQPSKKSKKDLLLSFAMQKGKYLSSSIGRNHTTDNTKTTYKIGPLSKTQPTTGITSATSMNHMSNESLLVSKLHASHAYRMGAKHAHHIHYRAKDEKTYLDRTKKGLWKISQKCGLKLNGGIGGGGVSSGCGGVSDGGNSSDGSTTITKYDCDTLREQFTDKLDAVSGTAGDVIHTNDYGDAKYMAKFPYKSYRSEIDLTKNLHYLDEFLNENFDKAAQANAMVTPSGKYKMHASNERHGHKHRQPIATNDGNDNAQGAHSKRVHRHRTRSNSKVCEFDANALKRANDSPENNYNGITGDAAPAVLSTATLQMQRDCVPTSTPAHSSNINDNLNGIMGQQRHQQQNQYAISCSGVGGSGGSGVSGVGTGCNGGSSASSGEKGATKSHTTSSSLSSSDYASVYSPCSQLNESNGKFTVNSVGLMAPPSTTIDRTPSSSSDPDAQGNGTMGSGNNDLLAKQKRYAPTIVGQYHKRHDMELPVFNVHPMAPTYYSDARPLNRIDGLRLDDDDDNYEQDEAFARQNVNSMDHINNPVVNNFLNASDPMNHLRGNNDKLSAYQYENQLSYHEDYLQHYYGKSQQPIASTSAHVQSLAAPMTTGHSMHTSQSHSGYGPSAIYRSTSISPSYTQAMASGTQPMLIRQQSNYPQNRVVMSKQKNGRSNAGDIVLEYEC